MMSKTSKVMMTALMLTLTTMMSAQELGTGNNTTGSKSHDHRASVGVSIAHDRHEGRHQGRPARHGRHDRMGCEPERYLVTDFDVYEKFEQPLVKDGWNVIVFVPSKEEDADRITCGNSLIALANK